MLMASYAREYCGSTQTRFAVSVASNQPQARTGLISVRMASNGERPVDKVT